MRRNGALIDLHDSVANGVKRKVCDRMQVQFAHQVGSVSFRGLDAETKGNSDFLRGLAFGNELNHFPFTRRQNRLMIGVLAFAVGAQVPVEHHLRDFRCEEGPAILQSFHSGDKISSGVGFQQEAACSHGQHFTHDLLGIVDGQNQDASIGHSGEHLTRGIKAVEVGHADIQQEDVRLQSGRTGDSLATVTGLTTNFPSGMAFEYGANALPGYFVIISDKDSKYAQVCTFRTQDRISGSKNTGCNFVSEDSCATTSAGLYQMAYASAQPTQLLARRLPNPDWLISVGSWGLFGKIVGKFFVRTPEERQ